MAESPVIDWRELEDRLDGDQELLLEIARLFVEHADAQIEDLRCAIQAERGEDIARAAHRLKGSLAQIAAAEGRELAFSLESAGRTGSREELLPLFGRLACVVRAAKTEFHTQLEAGH